MHNVHHYVYEEKVNRANVQKELDHYVAIEDREEGATGLPNPIRWREDVILDSREDAEKYIAEHDNGWYDQLAVRFRDVSNMTSAKVREATEKCNKAWQHYNDLNNKLYIDGVKSKVIGCKECGSRIPREWIQSNKCPVCRTDFRSETVQHNIRYARAKAEKAEQAILEEQKKLKDKAPIKWLVKIEYHT